MSRVTLGTLRENVKGDTYLVLAKGIEITKDGQSVDLGEFRTARLFDSAEGVQRLAQMNIISGDEVTEKLEYINSKRITSDVVILPAQK